MKRVIFSALICLNFVLYGSSPDPSSVTQQQYPSPPPSPQMPLGPTVEDIKRGFEARDAEARKIFKI